MICSVVAAIISKQNQLSFQCMSILCNVGSCGDHPTSLQRCPDGDKHYSCTSAAGAHEAAHMELAGPSLSSMDTSQFFEQTQALPRPDPQLTKFPGSLSTDFSGLWTRSGHHFQTDLSLSRVVLVWCAGHLFYMVLPMGRKKQKQLIEDSGNSQAWRDNTLKQRILVRKMPSMKWSFSMFFLWNRMHIKCSFPSCNSCFAPVISALMLLLLFVTHWPRMPPMVPLSVAIQSGLNLFFSRPIFNFLFFFFST